MRHPIRLGTEAKSFELNLAGGSRIGFDSDELLKRPHLTSNEQHIRNLNRLFVGAADLERQVAGTEPENDVVKQILAAPLKDSAVGVVAACLAAD